MPKKNRIARGRARRWPSPRGHSRHTLCALRKGSLSPRLSRPLLLTPALRDFWISASLVTREPKTVGQVARRGRTRVREREQENRRRGGRRVTTRRVPFRGENPFAGLQRAQQPLRDLRDYNGRRKKLCEMTSRTFLPPSLPPPSLLPISPILPRSSSRDADFFQNDGTLPLLPDYQKPYQLYFL